MTLEFHCVDCGEKNIPAGSRKVRCYPCWQKWNAAGGITFTIEPIVEGGGMKFGGGKIFHNFAIFCRACGARIRPQYEKYPHSNSRVLYALNCGGECHTCEECSIKRRWG